MPILGKLDLVKLVLPTTNDLPEDQQGWVKVNRNISHDDVAGAANLDSTMDTQKYTFARVVKEWNFTDEAGNTLEITVDNVSKLNYVDVEFVNKWVNDLFDELRKKEAISDDEAKKSSASSPQSIQVKSQ